MNLSLPLLSGYKIRASTSALAKEIPNCTVILDAYKARKAAEKSGYWNNKHSYRPVNKALAYNTNLQPIILYYPPANVSCTTSFVPSVILKRSSIR